MFLEGYVFLALSVDCVSLRGLCVLGIEYKLCFSEGTVFYRECKVCFFVTVEMLPPEQSRLLKWKISSVTPNVVKHTLTRSHFTHTKSELHTHTHPRPLTLYTHQE